MSFDKLIDRIKETKNPTVAGLDPNFSYIPAFIREKYADISDPLEAAAKAVLEFNCGLIDALCDIVPAVKPFAVAVIFIVPEAPSCFTTQRHFPLNAACVLPESFSTFAP